MLYMKYYIKEYKKASSASVYYRVYRKVSWYSFKEYLCYIDTSRFSDVDIRPYFKFMDYSHYYSCHTFSSLESAKSVIQRSIWYSGYSIYCEKVRQGRILKSTKVIHTVPPW